MIYTNEDIKQLVKENVDAIAMLSEVKKWGCDLPPRNCPTCWEEEGMDHRPDCALERVTRFLIEA